MSNPRSLHKHSSWPSMPFICTDNSLLHGLCDFALFLSLSLTDRCLVYLCSVIWSICLFQEPCYHAKTGAFLVLPYPDDFSKTRIHWLGSRNNGIFSAWQFQPLPSSPSPSIPPYTSQSLLTSVTQLPLWSLNSSPASLRLFVNYNTNNAYFMTRG